MSLGSSFASSSSGMRGQVHSNARQMWPPASTLPYPPLPIGQGMHSLAEIEVATRLAESKVADRPLKDGLDGVEQMGSSEEEEEEEAQSRSKVGIDEDVAFEDEKVLGN